MASKNAFEYATDAYRHSPEREILTPEGCQALLQVGEKTLRTYRERAADPIPHVEASNTHRYPRTEVLLWFAQEAKRPKEPKPD